MRRAVSAHPGAHSPAQRRAPASRGSRRPRPPQTRPRKCRGRLRGGGRKPGGAVQTRPRRRGRAGGWSSGPGQRPGSCWDAGGGRRRGRRRAWGESPPQPGAPLSALRPAPTRAGFHARPPAGGQTPRERWSSRGPGWGSQTLGWGNRERAWGRRRPSPGPRETPSWTAAPGGPWEERAWGVGQEADARPLRKPPAPPASSSSAGPGVLSAVRPAPSAAPRCPEEPAHVLRGLAGSWPASSRGRSPGPGNARLAAVREQPALHL